MNLLVDEFGQFELAVWFSQLGMTVSSFLTFPDDHDAKIIGFSVACGLLLVLIVTVAVLIVRK